MHAENRHSRARARDLITPTARPILFSAPMVRAILNDEDSKTQTRRVVSPKNSLVNGSPPCMRSDPEIICAWPNLDFSKAWVDRGPSPAGNPGPYLKVPGGDDSAHRVYSRVQPGDRLWVKETFRADRAEPPEEEDDPTFVLYRADLTNRQEREERRLVRLGPQLAAAHRWTPSIFMPRWASRITLEVTEVRAQRLQQIDVGDALREGVAGPCILDNFQRLWDSINGERPGCSWVDNPWVWAITFRRSQP